MYWSWTLEVTSWRRAQDERAGRRFAIVAPSSAREWIPSLQ
jgi:hypothetical protein